MGPNKYYSTFINNFVSVFRRYDKTPYVLTISGLSRFTVHNCTEVSVLIHHLQKHSISVILMDGNESVSLIEIVCKSALDSSSFATAYQIQSIPSLIEESSRVGIPIVCLIIMRCVARVICRQKILYKAIALDLDETIWKGTLSEVGAEQIKNNLSSEAGVPFISFMSYVRALAEELGIFVAICSRNDAEEVASVIEQLDEGLFPLKNQIDCIVANNNDKSENLILIANRLSILPGSIIFIDDNKLIRDEVRNQLPELFVPDWDNHNELISLLNVGCCFERNELSIKTQLRRKQFSIIQAERSTNIHPSLQIKVVDDETHANAIELYSKSNQFNFSQRNNYFSDNSLSMYFELYRTGGESLGICSTLTYLLTDDVCYIINWAISCRFFQIGVEEFVLLFISGYLVLGELLFITTTQA